MQITTTGLIIKEQKVGEADRLVTILSADKGIIRAFVPGGLRLKSRNLTASGLLAYSRFLLYKSRDTYKINQAESIELFLKLRNDIESLSLAGYFCELALCLAPEEDGAEDFLRLILNALYLLCENKRDPLLIKAAVELKICVLAGYMPDLSGCFKCHDEQALWFSARLGTLCCDKCHDEGGYALSGGMLAAMRHIVYSEVGKVFHFKLNEEHIKELSGLSERYVVTRTERDFATLSFYRSVSTGIFGDKINE